MDIITWIICKPVRSICYKPHSIYLNIVSPRMLSSFLIWNIDYLDQEKKNMAVNIWLEKNNQIEVNNSIS
jgi:hypothetical protein